MDIPVNHISLLLRSQSWMIMNQALNSLAETVDGGQAIVQNLLNDYYTSVCGLHPAISSLDQYCKVFKKQVSTGLIVPKLLIKKMAFHEGFSLGVQRAYQSFGVAWRLLDDIEDIEKDMSKGTRSAIYFCLPRAERTWWDMKNMGRNAGGKDAAAAVFDAIENNNVIGKIKDRICRELKAAAVTADDIGLKGLANEFQLLRTPLIEEES
jgi:hypothetical protein